MNRTFPRTILSVGKHDHWPEPLESRVADGSIVVDCVETLHDAAAALVLAGGTYQAVLLDLEVLSTREVAMINVVRRHVSQPMWVLPLRRNPSRLREALAQGAFPWEDASRVLEQWMQKATTLVPASGNRENPQEMARGEQASGFHDPELPRRRDAADNVRRHDLTNSAEIPVAAEIAARYDGLTGQPLLTEHEIRALLGTSE